MNMNWNEHRNLTMLTDFYELSMAGGYFENGIHNRIAVFDMFFRKIPDEGGFAVFAGLEQLIEYLSNIIFTDEDIDYLRSKGLFSEEFLCYLRDFSFSCDVWSVPEGTVVFPGEPLVTVRGPVLQAQLLETMLLLTVNHQSLIATKANRIVRAAKGRSIFEFGSRRAQGYDGAVLGARAAFIGGCDATACALADRDYGIPATGTMAHSWVQLFDTEYDAFAAYARTYPRNCTLLIDTYNVVKSGVPNAIKVFDDVLKPMGVRPQGVRIDSGDIAYLSKKTRSMLDAAGYKDVKIVASNSLDEYIIRDLLLQDAKVDLFGVGENLITSKSNPVFGGVYKLVAAESAGEYVPKIKISESVEKITTPCFKRLYRFYNRDNGKAIADYIALHDEDVLSMTEAEIFDPLETWKKKKISNMIVRELQQPVFKDGKLVYASPSLRDIKEYCAREVDSLWDEVKRFENPHKFYVDFSRRLWDKRAELLSELGQ